MKRGAGNPQRSKVRSANMKPHLVTIEVRIQLTVVPICTFLKRQEIVR